MNGETIQARLTIRNPMGFHMRPIAAFARRAALFSGTVTVGVEDRRVNGKSPLELMLLAAEQGTELVVEVGGTDPEAQQALAALVEIAAAPVMDDDEPTVPPKG
jgi:phosphocarrier protein